MNLLLHCCCGPCALATAGHFRSLGDQVTGWFFNPNLHPEEERQRREQAFAESAQAIGLAVCATGARAPAGREQGLRDFLLALASGDGRRCRACYGLRLSATAELAAAQGFDGFSTTLLISPHQDPQAIAELGRALGEKVGVAFRNADLRSLYSESCQRARELGLYRQNYCGCLFSRLERCERRARRSIEKALSASGG